MGRVPDGTPALELAWPRPGRGSSGPGTGDLRFDGRVATAGPEARLSAWLAADLRARVGAVSDVTPGCVRVRGSRLFLHLAAAGSPAAPPASADVDALWAACAHGLTDPLTRLVRRACGDPDPRARALAARRLLAVCRTRARAPLDEALVALLGADNLPDWIRGEVFLSLWRASATARRRWVELALATGRPELVRSAVDAVVGSQLPLPLVVEAAPSVAAAELDARWRRGSPATRTRLRERIEDLEVAHWRRLRAAAPPAAEATFAAWDAIRRGALSAPDLAAGALALEPDPDPPPSAVERNSLPSQHK